MMAATCAIRRSKLTAPANFLAAEDRVQIPRDSVRSFCQVSHRQISGPRNRLGIFPNNTVGKNPISRVKFSFFSELRGSIQLTCTTGTRHAIEGARGYLMAAPLQFDLTNFEPRLGRSVSIEQAATLLNVSRRTVYNRIREGRLQTIRTLGGSQRVLVESMYAMRPHEGEGSPG